MKKHITTLAFAIGAIIATTGCEPNNAENDPPATEVINTTDVPADMTETVSAAGNTVSDHVAAVSDTVSETVGNVTTSVTETANNVADNVNQTASELADSVNQTASDVAQSVSDTASDMADSASTTASDMANSVNDTVNDAMNTPEVATVTETVTETTDNANMDKEMAKRVAAMCAETDMPGSWQVSEVTPEVKQAVKVLGDSITSDSPVKQVNDVRIQVVNGTNYAIEVELENGELWYGKIYRNLRNDYMMDSVAVQGKMCP